MLLRAALRAFVAAQLRSAQTDAGAKVAENRALPIAVEALPAIVVATPHERKESRGKGATLYITTVTLQLSLRATGASDELAACAVERLLDQVLTATLANQALISFDGVQQFPTAESAVDISSDGGIVLATARLQIEVEIMERIDPTHPVPFTDIRATVTDSSGDAADHTLAIFDAPLAS